MKGVCCCIAGAPRLGRYYLVLSLPETRMRHLPDDVIWPQLPTTRNDNLKVLPSEVLLSTSRCSTESESDPSSAWQTSKMNPPSPFPGSAPGDKRRDAIYQRCACLDGGKRWGVGGWFHSFKGPVSATPLFMFTSGNDKLNCLKEAPKIYLITKRNS